MLISIISRFARVHSYKKTKHNIINNGLLKFPDREEQNLIENTFHVPLKNHELKLAVKTHTQHNQ